MGNQLRISHNLKKLFYVTFVIHLVTFTKVSGGNTSKPTTDDVEHRIFKGMVAPEGMFKFVVYVTAIEKCSSNGVCTTSTCTGSLINPHIILLAAHCFDKVKLGSSIMTVAGKANLTTYKAARSRKGFDTYLDEKKYGVQERRGQTFHIHPLYIGPSNHFMHDIAVIRLEEPYDVNDTIVETIPISLTRMEGKMKCTALGWGLIGDQVRTDELHYLDARLTSHKCSGGKKSFLCFSSLEGGICKGDSGGPLVCDGKVWGVASHSAYTPGQKMTCLTSMEAVYAEIYPEIQWVNSRVNLGNEIKPMGVAVFVISFLHIII